MATTKWVIDAAHSEVLFKVKHLMVTNVTGQFSSFEGKVEAENDDFSTSKIEFTADVNTISTNNEQRDAHLLASSRRDENCPERHQAEQAHQRCVYVMSFHGVVEWPNDKSSATAALSGLKCNGSAPPPFAAAPC